MIQNIVFDMGGVLIRFDPALFMQRAGVPEADRALVLREVYRSPEWVMMDRGLLTDTEAAAILCRRLPARLHEAVYELTALRDRPILEVDGMYALISELKEKGYGVYLLSNANCRQHDYWPRVPASKFFDGTLVSCDVKLLKPMPEIYRRLLRGFHLRADECFFIDDSPANVEAALYVGLHGAVFHDDIRRLRRELREAGVDIAP